MSDRQRELPIEPGTGVRTSGPIPLTRPVREHLLFYNKGDLS